MSPFKRTRISTTSGLLAAQTTHAADLPQNTLIAPASTCDPGFKCWTIGVHTDWYPLSDLRLAIEDMRLGIGSAFSGQPITLDKAKGNRPTGAYLARDLGITSVAFRAQRNFGDANY